jgi:hypothetical protein
MIPQIICSVAMKQREFFKLSTHYASVYTLSLVMIYDVVERRARVNEGIAIL